VGSRTSRGARLLALALLSATIAAGCGGGAPNAQTGSSTANGTKASTAAQQPVPANLKKVETALQGLSGSAREQKLLSLAKAEGSKVNVDTSLSDLVVAPLEKQWAKSYPGTKLKLYRASSEDVSARVLAERQADKSGADVVETNGTNMLTFQNRKDVLVPYTGSPNAAPIAKDYRFPTFTADRVEKFVIAWNTKLVPDPPKSYTDLADPKWKNKVAIEPTDVDWFATLYTYLQQHGGPGGAPLAQDKLDATWKAIAANSQIINGHTDQANALAAGQVQVLLSGHAQSLEQLQAKHAPIAFRPFVTPVIERPQGVGLVYGLAHPATALLFYDWLLGPTGQKTLQSNGVEAANPQYPDPNFSAKPPTVKMELPPIVARYKEWQSKYESFTNAPAAG
jgi:iron(III) transport system substrate-binding protein